MPAVHAAPIYIRPAWDSENMFCRMLADVLVAEKLEVRELGFGARAVPIGPGTIFLHWPNEMFFRRTFRSDARTLLTLTRIALGKRRHGLRLVWMVHNLLPHEREDKPFGLARRWFFRLLDGVIFLSRASREQFVNVYPQLAHLPHLETVHGHYLSCATRPPTPSSPVRNRPVRFGAIGRVKRYKAPEQLAKAVAALPPGTAIATIAGECDDPALRDDLMAWAASPAVNLHFGTLDNVQLEELIDASDAIVMPYRDILNSGSAMHVLSRARPFVAPRLGSLIELQTMIGHEWVYLYEGAFGPDTLAAATEWIGNTPRPASPDLSEFAWPGIGEPLARFLKRL